MKKTFLTFLYKTKQKDRKKKLSEKNREEGEERCICRETGAKERVFSKFEKAG